jgi:hypothetical protein
MVAAWLGLEHVTVDAMSRGNPSGGADGHVPDRPVVG